MGGMTLKIIQCLMGLLHFVIFMGSSRNIELIAILRNIYGQDFIDIFEKSLEDIEELYRIRSEVS